MNEFKFFYLWGINVKSYWGLYFLAITFFLGVVAFFTGTMTLPLMQVFQSALITFIMAFSQAFIIPDGKEYETSTWVKRVIAWTLLTMVVSVIIALVGKWFTHLPSFILILFCLYMVIACVCVAIWRYFEAEKDTIWLNKKLDDYRQDASQ